eukprot:TRINITY_DN3660_c0_g1_i1.p1 TRINITY_DN3660_c0_g1~~TRINITY_DN3660_c0_g1_i1.p1  ORF type:complete len:141 (+),score=35.44 TRINITY_DN3660_c0_g1_i1:305-727(+)
MIIAFIGGVILCIGFVAVILSLRGGKKGGNKSKEPAFPPEGSELEGRPDGDPNREVGVGFESQPPPPLEDPLIPDSVRRFETEPYYPSYHSRNEDPAPDDADEEFIITRDDLIRMSHRYPPPGGGGYRPPPPNDLSNLPI